MRTRKLRETAEQVTSFATHIITSHIHRERSPDLGALQHLRELVLGLANTLWLEELTQTPEESSAWEEVHSHTSELYAVSMALGGALAEKDVALPGASSWADPRWCYPVQAARSIAISLQLWCKQQDTAPEPAEV